MHGFRKALMPEKRRPLRFPRLRVALPSNGPLSLPHVYMRSVQSCHWVRLDEHNVNAGFNYFRAIQVKSCFLISECTNWQAPGVWISSYSGNSASRYKWRVLTSFKGSWNTTTEMSNIITACSLYALPGVREENLGGADGGLRGPSWRSDSFSLSSTH